MGPPPGLDRVNELHFFDIIDSIGDIMSWTDAMIMICDSDSDIVMSWTDTMIVICWTIHV